MGGSLGRVHVCLAGYHSSSPAPVPGLLLNYFLTRQPLHVRDIDRPGPGSAGVGIDRRPGLVPLSARGPRTSVPGPDETMLLALTYTCGPYQPLDRSDLKELDWAAGRFLTFNSVPEFTVKSARAFRSVFLCSLNLEIRRLRVFSKNLSRAWFDVLNAFYLFQLEPTLTR